MSSAALCFVLQALLATGSAAAHSAAPEIDAASIACLASTARHPPSRPDGPDAPLCCLLLGARDCDAPPTTLDLLFATELELPRPRAHCGRLALAVERRGARPTGWASSWSSRAPPFFS